MNVYSQNGKAGNLHIHNSLKLDPHNGQVGHFENTSLHKGHG